jgi:hypothetical protein
MAPIYRKTKGKKKCTFHGRSAIADAVVCVAIVNISELRDDNRMHNIPVLANKKHPLYEK